MKCRFEIVGLSGIDGKKFLIIGNMNAVTYKEIFPLIKNNELWLGVPLTATKCSFIVNEDYDGNNTYYENGIKYGKVNNAVWFTNLDHKKRHEEIDLYKKYNADEFPHYDNYDAIEVGKVSDIPMNYDGIMGVPITFLDKFCPTQFEIIGDACNGSDHQWDYFKPMINGKFVYKRILIKKKRNGMKKFLIIGNANSVKCNDVFPHIASGEVFLRTKDGVTNFAMLFKTPEGEIKEVSALWYTNLDSRHLYKELNLTKEYSPEEYPKYDNYDAIDVGCVKNI